MSISSGDRPAQRPSGRDGEPSTAELMVAFASSAEGGVALLDRAGRMQWCNPALERLTGFTCEELVGRAFHVRTLAPLDDAQARDQALDAAERDGPQTSRSWHVTRDGRRYSAQVTTRALRSPEGELLGFVHVVLDVTAEQRAVEEARHSEERYKAMVDSVRDYAIFMLDPDGVVRTWNLGAQRTKGYAPSEIIGQHFSRFYTPEDARAGRPRALLREATEKGRVEDVGWRVRKDGTRFWADVVITAIRDAHGALQGFVKVTRDLSERKKAEEDLRQSEERFRLLVEGVEDYAIFMLDPQGRVATWNAGAERIKGYRPAEIIGQHFSRFYTPEDIAAHKPERELELAARTGRVEDEGWRVRKDGTRFRASVLITALHNESGKLLGFAKVTRDLTERMRAEEERIRLAKTEEAVRLREDFLSIASHELKTPLTSLQLQIESMTEGVQLDPRTAARVERARRSMRRLLDLVEALLDVSRISTGKLALERAEVDLGALAAEVVDRLSLPARDAGCTVQLTAEPVVGFWDRLRIDQVLSNLLTNAFRYAYGAPIEVSVRRQGDEAALVVRDHGPGIPDEAKRRVFERFERAGSKRHYGGLGLGLFVVREVVEQHGGSIKLDDAPGGGARFTVLLPLGAREGTT